MASVTAIAQRSALKLASTSVTMRKTPTQGEHAEQLQGAVGRRAALDDDGEVPHTRSTCFDPKSPCGRT